MERRKAKRIITGYRAEIIYKGNAYKAVIESLSEGGVSVTVSPGAHKDFLPGTAVDLKFQPHKEETLILNCKIKWTDKVHPRAATRRIGLEIVNPPWDKSSVFV